MGQLFGTDGVRGVAGRDLSARLAMDLAVAAAEVLGDCDGFAAARSAHRRPVAVIGRDPRVSGEFLEAAVVAGLAGSGVDVLRLGVVPTPAVAYLTERLGAEFGVMLSASHNPAPDNGIKFFGRGGLKLPDEVEDEIEALMARGDSGGTVPEAGFGRVLDAADEAERYLEHLLATVGVPAPRGIGHDARHGAGDGPLAGMRVVVDCAHGAASRLAPRLLRAAGAEVIAIGVDPDGTNINAGCGSTSLGALQKAVTEHRADAGIAHDGDADRCLAVDAHGEVVDGDHILAILALALKAEGQLAGDTVVATVMSNLGFRRAMRDAGINVVETPVGDRYLIAAMRQGGYVLGGEQSGHIIMLNHAKTGDGMLTALHLLTVAARYDQPLAKLAEAMTRYPQVLVNVHGVDKAKVAASERLAAAIGAAEAELGESGRVLVRPSGTEPAVRVMVECVDSGQAQAVADRLADHVRSAG
ncbi:MAG TPA: phosphoglucosamine mutase [Streptosporangiaceae bacterium]|nr:phosphoglucosamine mutase [Streptosporangiaceae bacterium]